VALYGSTIPLDAGGFVVTVVCPNRYSKEKLMQSLNSIVPEAGQPETLVVDSDDIPGVRCASCEE
jgi:hypothetical protein